MKRQCECTTAGTVAFAHAAKGEIKLPDFIHIVSVEQEIAGDEIPVLEVSRLPLNC